MLKALLNTFFEVAVKVTKKLAEFVSSRMQELNLSTHAVARNANNNISNGSVHNIANENVQDIKDATFDALAKGLLMTPGELRAAVAPDTAAVIADMTVKEFVSLKFGGKNTRRSPAEIEMLTNLLDAEIERMQNEE
jgi:hypothetical protein